MSNTPAPSSAETPRPLPRVYLIRHGQTEWSLSGQHTGSTDIPLTEKGVEEARGMAPLLHGIAFSRVLSSPRQRAIETARNLGLADNITVDPDLAEWQYGVYEGKTSKQIRAERPDWEIFRDGAPGGESPEEVSARADRLIARLKDDSGNIALFTHGHFGAVLAVRWLALPVAHGQHFPLSTASLSVLADVPRHPGIPVLSLWNYAPEEWGEGAGGAK